MGQALYVERELIPFAEEGKEIMFVFRDPGFANAPPVAYVTALEPETQVEFRSGSGPNTDSYSATTSFTLSERGQVRSEDLPVGGAALTNPVTVLRVLSGAAAVTVVSPVSVKAEFRTRKHP